MKRKYKAPIKPVDRPQCINEIKIENCELNELYSITINPPDTRDDKIVDMDQSVFLLQHDMREMFKTLQEHLKGVGYMELYPELSPTGRLHYHGMFTIKDIIRFYYKDLYFLQTIGQYKIATMKENKDKTREENYEEWEKYVTKQRLVIEPLLTETNWEYPAMIKGCKEDLQEDF